MFALHSWSSQVNNSLIVGTAAILAGCIVALPAWATVVDVNITGTVETGSDASGVFGVAGASLAGDDFSIAYVFDTSLASPSSTNTNVFGGSIFSPPINSPVVSSSITINGITLNLNGNGYGQMQLINTGLALDMDYVSDGTTGDLNSDIVVPPTTASVTTAFDVPLFGTGNAFLEYGTISANLSPTAYSAEIVGATPLPAAVLLFGSGLLGLGALIRRASTQGAMAIY
jgi:hypothetical protein